MTSCVLLLVLSCSPKLAALDVAYIGSNVAQATLSQHDGFALPYQHSLGSAVATTVIEPLLVSKLPPRPRLIFKIAKLAFNVYAIQRDLRAPRRAQFVGITLRFPGFHVSAQ